MEEAYGMWQTTKGVWISATKECTLVFDIEGTDSNERGD